MPSERLHLHARGRPDRLQRLAAVADQDALLRVALHDQRRVDLREVALALHLVDHHGDRVRHLLARDAKRLFADELGQRDLERLVGVLVRREQRRPLGHARHQQVAQHVDALAVARRHRHDLVELPQLLRGRELRHQVVVVQAVDLVRDADLHAARRRDLLRVDVGVAATHPGRDVHDHHDGVHALDRVAHQVVEPRAEERAAACGTPACR